MKSINDEAYFGVNPTDPFSSLTDEGREKAMDYINLLHASGMYEKQTAKIIPFRSIDIIVRFPLIIIDYHPTAANPYR